MAFEVRTKSEIRNAKSKAIGGAPKRCVKGKNCSATCIAGNETCLVELPESVGMSISRVRDYLNNARGQVINEFQPLRTAKEGADWLLEHKDEIAMWGIDDTKAKNIIKQKPQYITIGVEPGGGREGAEALKEIVPGLKDLPVVRRPNEKRKDDMSDELQKVNNYKMALEVSKALNQQNPEAFSKTFSQQFGQRFINAGLDITEFEKILKNDKVLENGIVRFDKAGTREVEGLGNTSWGRKQKYITEGAGMREATFGALNPSGLWKPMEGYSQFAELFKQAGYSEREAGPFQSQKTWLNYAANAVKGRMQEIVDEVKPNLMYISKRNNQALVKVVESTANGDKGNFSISGKSKAGNDLSVDLKYFLHNHPDGSRTVFVVGPHSSMLGFKGKEEFVKATGEVVRSLSQTGKLPSSLSDQSIKLGNKPAPSPKKTTVSTATKTTGVPTSSITKTTGVPSATVKTNPDSQPSLKSEARPKSQPSTPERPKFRPQGTDPVKWVVEAPPGGRYSANDVWAALNEYNKDRVGWRDQAEQIKRQVREKYGGYVVEGEKVEDFRKRLTLSGLLPQPSGENYNEHKPSTRWDMLPRGIHQPSRVG